MATHKGSSGLVKNGSNTVAEVRTWTLNTNADTIEDTAMGDSARTYLAGLTSADASVDVFWDETDTNGQVALAPGSSVTLVLISRGRRFGRYLLHWNGNRYIEIHNRIFRWNG